MGDSANYRYGWMADGPMVWGGFTGEIQVASMQLKSGSSLWLRGGGETLGPGPVTRNLHCDVAILGAGITGALVGQQLSQAGVDVLMVDRREACQGSTAASTGLLQYELDTTLLEVIQKRGEAQGFEAYRLCFEAVAKFPEYLAGLGIDCGVERRESLYLATCKGEEGGLQKERDARHACGIKVEYLGQEELWQRFALDRPGALWSPGALAIDPYRTGLGLLERAIGAGMRVHTGTGVRGYQADETGVTLETDTGYHIRARKVVFATGYETPEFLRVDVALKTTYALASQPGVTGPGWHPQCMIWETAEPYLYIRAGPEGRAIIGGGDDGFKPGGVSTEHLEAKARELEARFGKLIPGVMVSREFVWSGVFAETDDGLPYIGCTEKFPRGYFALGYGGNGILFSFIAAGIIRDLFMGKACGRAGLFRFDR